MQGEFITTDYISTFAGLVMVTTLVVQFTKPVVKWFFGFLERCNEIIWIYTWLVAFGLQAFAMYVTGGFTTEILGLAAINAVAAALSAVGTYHCLKN